MKRRIIFKESIKTLLCMALITSVHHVLAADWESIAQTASYEMLVDIDSFNVEAGHPYMTANTVYKTTQTYDGHGVKFNYLTKHTTTQFNCQAHTYKQLKTLYYNANQRVVGHTKAQAQFNKIIPNSTMATLESLVCQVHKMVGGE